MKRYAGDTGLLGETAEIDDVVGNPLASRPRNAAKRFVRNDGRTLCKFGQSATSRDFRITLKTRTDVFSLLYQRRAFFGWPLLLALSMPMYRPRPIEGASGSDKLSLSSQSHKS